MPLSVRILGVELDTGLLLLAGGFLFLIYPFVFYKVIREAYSELHALVPGRGTEGTVLEGVATEDEILTAPVSGAPCVAWQIRVYGRRQIWGETAVREVASVPFRVGATPIDLGTEFEFPPRLASQHSYALGSTGPIPPELVSRLRELELFDRVMAARRYGAVQVLREWRLDAGSACTVARVAAGADHAQKARVAPGLLEEARRRLLRGLLWQHGQLAFWLLLIPVGILLLNFLP